MRMILTFYVALSHTPLSEITAANLVNKNAKMAFKADH
jgi:hypothetical protein